MTTVLAFLLLCTATDAESTSDYGMVIDAGSTHTELYVYQFADRVTHDQNPPKSSPNQIAGVTYPDPVAHLTNQQETDIFIQVMFIHSLSYAYIGQHMFPYRH